MWKTIDLEPEYEVSDLGKLGIRQRKLLKN